MLFSTESNYRISASVGRLRSVFIALAYGVAIVSLWCWQPNVLPWQSLIQCCLSFMFFLLMPCLRLKHGLDLSANTGLAANTDNVRKHFHFMLTNKGRWTWLSLPDTVGLRIGAIPPVYKLLFQWLRGLSLLRRLKALRKLRELRKFRKQRKYRHVFFSTRQRSQKQSSAIPYNPTIPWQLSSRSRASSWVLWLYLEPEFVTTHQSGTALGLSNVFGYRATGHWLWVFRDEVSEQDFRRLALCIKYQQKRIGAGTA